jgi:hypothetical protein
MIRVLDASGKVTETHERTGESRECEGGLFLLAVL